MWNFFVMFFYETSLEISMSLVIGFRYVWALDKAYDCSDLADSVTLRFHRIFLYVFFVLLVLGLAAVFIIMTDPLKP